MFQAIILPIFRSTRLCVTACGIMHRYKADRCIIPQAVTHSLVLLKTGKITARNMLSSLELLLLSYLVGCLYYLYFIILFLDFLNNLNLTLILKTWRIW